MASRLRKGPFECPICTSSTYERVRVRRGAGWYQTEFYKCGGCSAMFHDPVRFNCNVLAERYERPDIEPEGTIGERAKRRP